MRFSYRNEYQDYRKHQELLHGSAYKALRAHYYSGLILPIGLGVTGLVGTLPHNPPIAFVIAGFLIGYLVKALPYRKHYDRATRLALKAIPEKDIILEVQEDGLQETVEGIKSFCPWASIHHFQLFQDVLFISLASNLWAIVPSRFLAQSESSLADLMSVLRAHNIEEKR